MSGIETYILIEIERLDILEGNASLSAGCGKCAVGRNGSASRRQTEYTVGLCENLSDDRISGGTSCKFFVFKNLDYHFEYLLCYNITALAVKFDKISFRKGRHR